MVGPLGGPTNCHFDIKLADPSALLGANLHKIAEPVDPRDELKDKDALDILRLVRGVPIERLAGGLRSSRRQGAERRRPDRRSFPSGTSSGGRQPRVRDGIPCCDASREPGHHSRVVRSSGGRLAQWRDERMNSFLRDGATSRFGWRSGIRTPRERAGQRPEQAGGALMSAGEFQRVRRVVLHVSYR
jgi:hypothetical protein